jgi:hypothetical protein
MPKKSKPQTQTERRKRMNKIDALVIEPGRAPYHKRIDSGLESLQKEVGGYIEAVYPFSDPVALICNEDGKLLGLELNRALRDDEGDIYDIISGTFLIVGLTEDNFGSLPVELSVKYALRFAIPEWFTHHDGTIRVHSYTT